MDIIRAPAGPHQGPWFSVGLINSHIIENYQGRDYADEGIEVHTVGTGQESKHHNKRPEEVFLL